MRIVVICDQYEQRHALSDVVRKIGARLVDAMDVDTLINAQTLPSADVWFLDAPELDDQLHTCIDRHAPAQVLMGFSVAPFINDDKAYNRWQRSLIRRIRSSLAVTGMILPPQELAEQQVKKVTDISSTANRSANLVPRAIKSNKNWRYVLFLGASMGGPQAVKEILDHLSPSLPVTVVVAHHFDTQMLYSLPRLLTRHNDWRCEIVSMSQSLRAGQCLIVPTTHKVVCDSTGRLIATQDPWTGDYRPNIGEMLKNLSDVFGGELIGVILSGMGNDGSQYADKLFGNHSFLWAQDPATCVSPSQPQAFIDTGAAQFVGSPKQIADKVNGLLKLYANISQLQEA